MATFTEHMKPRGQFGKEGVVEAVVVAVMTAGAGNGGGLPPPPPPPPPLLGVGATTTGAGVCPNIAKSEKPDVSHDTVWSEVSVEQPVRDVQPAPISYFFILRLDAGTVPNVVGSYGKVMRSDLSNVVIVLVAPIYAERLYGTPRRVRPDGVPAAALNAAAPISLISKVT